MNRTTTTVMSLALVLIGMGPMVAADSPIDDLLVEPAQTCSGATDADVEAVAGGGPGGSILIGASGCYNGPDPVTVSWSDSESQKSGSCEIGIAQDSCADTTTSNEDCASVNARITNLFGSQLASDFDFFCL